MNKLQLQKILEDTLVHEQSMVDHEGFLKNSYDPDTYHDILLYCGRLEKYYRAFPTHWLLWETLKGPYPEIYATIGHSSFVPHAEAVELVKAELEKLKNE